MAGKYKGFKGSGMRETKTAQYKIDRLVKECFIRYFANGCKIPRDVERTQKEG